MAVIYVVDEEPLLLDLISVVLRRAGHQVITSVDPAEASEAIIAAEPPINMIIAEADMHPLSGLKLVRQLRRKNIDCPVIFMSWHQGLGSAITNTLGRHAIIEKPFTADQLRKIVQQFLPATVPGNSHAWGN